MWVESLEHVGDQAVGLCVQRLDEDERERTAALLAWVTLDAIRGGGDESMAWTECVNEILRQHVALSVPDERLERPESPWWNELISRALQEFVRQNDLAPAIGRHLHAFQGIGVAGQRES